GPPPVPSNQYLPSYQRPSLPPPSQAPSLDDLSLAFDNLAMALRLTAGPQEIDDFQRRQEPWIKEALHPNLLALLRSAFHFIDANEKQQEKVLKIISIWGDKHYFDDIKINALKSGVMVPPPPPGGPPSVTFPGMAPPGHPAFGHIRYQNPQNVSPFYNQGAPPPPNMFPGAHSPAQSIISSSTHLSPPVAHGHLRPNSEPAPPGIPGQFPSGPSPPDMSMQGIGPRPNVSVTPPIPTVPEKKYYELPAGLMVPAVSDPPYTPIHAASIRLPPHRLPPTTELLEAVDKFYEGMKLIEYYHRPSYRRKRDDRGRLILIHQVVVVVAREVASVIDVVVEVIVAQDQALGYEQELNLGQYPVPDPGLHLGQDQDPMNEAEVEVIAVIVIDKNQVNMVRRHAKDIKVDHILNQDRGRLHITRDEGARADKMISDHNVGFQMLKKLGWEGAGTGLGSSTTGIVEPIKGGEVRLGEQKYLGVGHNQGDEDDIFDQYRKAKSYTYQRSDINSKDKKPAGCFRCGK
ncbi:4139_t:CDS:2, partial [Racocetra fulgida]